MIQKIQITKRGAVAFYAHDPVAAHEAERIVKIIETYAGSPVDLNPPLCSCKVKWKEVLFVKERETGQGKGDAVLVVLASHEREDVGLWTLCQTDEDPLNFMVDFIIIIEDILGPNVVPTTSLRVLCEFLTNKVFLLSQNWADMTPHVLALQECFQDNPKTSQKPADIAIRCLLLVFRWVQAGSSSRTPEAPLGWESYFEWLMEIVNRDVMTDGVRRACVGLCSLLEASEATDSTTAKLIRRQMRSRSSGDHIDPLFTNHWWTTGGSYCVETLLSINKQTDDPWKRERAADGIRALAPFAQSEEMRTWQRDWLPAAGPAWGVSPSHTHGEPATIIRYENQRNGLRPIDHTRVDTAVLRCQITGEPVTAEQLAVIIDHDLQQRFTGAAHVIEIVCFVRNDLRALQITNHQRSVVVYIRDVTTGNTFRHGLNTPGRADMPHYTPQGDVGWGKPPNHAELRENVKQFLEERVFPRVVKDDAMGECRILSTVRPEDMMNSTWKQCLRIPRIQINLTESGLLHHKEWLFDQMQCALQSCRGDGAASDRYGFVSIIWMWRDPFRVKERMHHATLACVDFQREVWVFFDPNGGDMTFRCPETGIVYLSENRYTLLSEVFRDDPRFFRLVQDRDAMNLDLQRVFEHVPDDNPYLTCPVGMCTIVCWVVVLLCRRFGYYDMHHVGWAACGLLLDTLEQDGQEKYLATRLLLWNWQSQLIECKSSADFLWLTGLSANRGGTVASHHGCLFLVDGVFCPSSPASLEGGIFCAKHERHAEWTNTSMLPRHPEIVSAPSPALVHWKGSDGVLLFFNGGLSDACIAPRSPLPSAPSTRVAIFVDGLKQDNIEKIHQQIRAVCQTHKNVRIEMMEPSDSSLNVMDRFADLLPSDTSFPRQRYTFHVSRAVVL